MIAITIPDEVMQTAKKMYKARLDNFPEDDWVCFQSNGQDYDLNLWKDGGQKHATLYQVFDGMTDVTRFWRIK